jgi:murein DD-endopeptidase MepM/ murein hydrolase activator NlpD
MRAGLFGGVVVVFLALAVPACGGGDSALQAVVVVHTVAPTETPAALEHRPDPVVGRPELLLSTTEVYQAGAILVSLVGPAVSGQVTFLGRQYTLNQGSQSIYTFVGVSADDPPGHFPLRVDFALANGTRGSLTEVLVVLPTEWTVEEIEFDEAQQELLAPAVVNAENIALARAYSGRTPQKLWDGPWQMPVLGAVTARFGEQRSINGAPASGHHSGTDIATAEGTPVVATNSGVVVLARELRIRGNMVIIDHGGGVFSGYAHLSSITVTEGQPVSGGETIGAVGNTGLSTGAHLHWEMAVNGVLVDALRFLDGTNGF